MHRDDSREILREGTRFPLSKGRDLSLPPKDLVEILRAVLHKEAPVRFRAKGFSMSPFIKNQDVVTLTPLKEKSLRSGDVIAFVLPETGTLCVHRIVGRKGDLYLAKGDNSSGADESVLRRDILGFVTRVERDGREVYLGLGPERFLIAFLGARGLLLPLLHRVRELVHGMVKRGPN